MRDQRGGAPVPIGSPSSLNQLGLPVIHSTSRRSRKTPPTTARPPGCSMSVAEIHPMISPHVRPNPLFSASYMPFTASLLHPEILHSYIRLISSVPSDEPAATIKAF